MSDQKYRAKIALPARVKEFLEEVQAVGYVFKIDAAGGFIMLDLEPTDEYELACTIRDLQDALNSSGVYDVPVAIGRPAKVAPGA